MRMSSNKSTHRPVGLTVFGFDRGLPGVTIHELRELFWPGHTPDIPKSEYLEILNILFFYNIDKNSIRLL